MPHRAIDTNWINRYVYLSAIIKGIKTDSKEYPIFSEALTNALRRIYRAVAVDIDGTLTYSGTLDVPQRLSSFIVELLQRGLPIILITGR
jgi:hypothetical protein